MEKQEIVPQDGSEQPLRLRGRYRDGLARFVVASTVILLAIAAGTWASPPVWAAPKSELITVSESVTEDQVVLELSVRGNPSYRVWQTPSPSKLIIDLFNTAYTNPPLNKALDDVLAQRLRIARYTDYTRVVLELKQKVPEPKHWVENDRIIIQIDKQYNQGYETIVSSGIRYGEFRQGSDDGQIMVNYIKISGNRVAGSIRPVLANNGSGGLQGVSGMSEDHNALAGINAGFFSGTGATLGLLILDGEICSYPFYNRTAFGITGDGKVLFEQVDFSGDVVKPNGQRIPITGVNRIRRSDDVLIYTKEYGFTTRTNNFGTEVVVVDGLVTERNDQGNTVIPEDGYVISAHGEGARAIAELTPGDPVSAQWELSPDWLGQGVLYAVGGGPRLIREGKVYITSGEERFQADIARGRAPRTAVGVTGTGQLLFVVVNGRQADVSIGVTLEELAELMLEMGAVDAMNLDGGGSTTLVVRGRVLNLPSDGRERPVGSAVLVLPE